MDLLSFTAIFFTILTWSSAFVGIKLGLAAFSPESLTIYRFLVASAVLLVYALWKRIPAPDLADWPRLLGISVLGISAYHLWLNTGEQTIQAGTACLIIAAGPVFTALLSWWWLGERMRLWGWLGMLMSIAGVVLIVGGQGQSVALSWGALYILAAAMVTSVYFVLQKPLVQRYGALRFTIYSLLAGTLPLLLFVPKLWQEWNTAPIAAHMAVWYLGIFPAALGYIAWSFALNRVSVSRVSSFLYVSPVFAVILAYFWLDEVPTLLTLLGGVLALCGVMVLNRWGKVHTVQATVTKAAS